MNLLELHDYEVDRIFNHYMAIKGQTDGLCKPMVVTLPVAAPYVWLKDLGRHYNVTPISNITDNKTSAIVLMRADVPRFEKRIRCQYRVTKEFIPSGNSEIGKTAYSPSFGRCAHSYELQGFVGNHSELKKHARQDCAVIELEQGLALIPLTSRFRDMHKIPFLPLTEPDDLIKLMNKNEELPKEIADFAALLTCNGETLVGYVEASYRDGFGVQAGAVWKFGKLVYGPEMIADIVNNLLAELGARKNELCSEIETIGLDRHCATDAWVDDDEDNDDYDDI